MFESFKKYLKDRIVVTDNDIDLFRASVHSRKFRKGQYLLQREQVCHFVAFVTAGCLRTYRVDNKGQEHIIYFAIENYWAGDRESYVAEAPSKFYIDAIEASEVILFTKGKFETLCSEIPAFGNLINSTLQNGFIAAQNRVHAAISFTAEEKYKDFLLMHPKLSNRIPQHMIASYLGMTPETLSRIRKSILNVKK